MEGANRGNVGLATEAGAVTGAGSCDPAVSLWAVTQYRPANNSADTRRLRAPRTVAGTDDDWTMQRLPHFVLALFALASLAGCGRLPGDYIAASSISRNGFAVDAEQMRKAHGKEIRMSGFVDHGNIYGDDGARAILREWWSGYGPDAVTWQFNLKARADDETGHSLAINVADDEGRDRLLKAFVADARQGRPTTVYVTGRIFTFDAPTNSAGLTGLYVEVASSRDILLALPDDN